MIPVGFVDQVGVDDPSIGRSGIVVVQAGATATPVSWGRLTRKNFDGAVVKSHRTDITIEPGSMSTTAVLMPDVRVTQIGKRYDEMVEPGMYVSLDTSWVEATLTIAEGPCFGVLPGQSVELKVKRKTI